MLKSMDIEGGDRMVLAASKGDVALVRDLIRQGFDVNYIGDDGFTPLKWAVYGNCVETARILLQCGADPNLRYEDWNDTTALDDAVSGNCIELVSLLQSYGAHPEKRTWVGLNALDRAKKRGEDDPVY